MKIKVYSVLEKLPPANIDVLIIDTDDEHNIINIEYATAEIAIIDEEEIKLHPDPNLVKTMIWVNNNTGNDMQYSDLWAAPIVSI